MLRRILPSLILSLGFAIATFASVAGIVHKDFFLVAAPALFASLIILLKALLHRERFIVVIDGSNVMHWCDGQPNIEVVRMAVERVSAAGFEPFVVFDANVGYLVCGHYRNAYRMARLIGLEPHHVEVAPRGTPADPLILERVRRDGGWVMSNDRFRDWQAEFPDETAPDRRLRGGFENGSFWAELSEI